MEKEELNQTNQKNSKVGFFSFESVPKQSTCSPFSFGASKSKWNTKDILEKISIGDVDAVNTFLASGLANEKELCGNALVSAAEMNQLEITKLLISAVNNSDSKVDLSGYFLTASFIKAIEKGHIEVVRLLIHSGFDMKNWEKPALQSAVNTDNLEILKLLIDSGANINYEHESFGRKISALSQASDHNQIDMVKLLIDSGVNVANFGGMALWNSACRNHLEVAKLLIHAGACVNESFQPLYLTHSCTPLHCAVFNRSLEMVELLLDSGADETIKNGQGKTALEIADDKSINDLLANYNGTKFILK